VVSGANATGKTFALARIAVAFAALGWLVVVTSTGEKQLREQLMARAFSFWRQAHLGGDFHELRWRLDRSEESGIVAVASDTVSRYGGYHSAVGVLVLIDEAQGVPSEAWDGLRSSLLGAGRRRWVASGNPLFASGRFYDAAHTPHWNLVTLSALDVPNVAEGRPVIPGLIDAEAVEQTARDFGPGSDYYKSRILAQFPGRDEFGLCEREWLEASARRWEMMPPVSVRTREPTILGVDVARGGSALTCCAVRVGNTIRDLVLWNEDDLMRSARRVVEVGRKWGCVPRGYSSEPGTVIVDVVGVGAGLRDALHHLDYATDSFNGGEKAKTRGPGGVPFQNRRAEAAWNCRTLLQRGALALPRDQKLWDEFTSMRWRQTPDGKVGLEVKLDLAQRLGRSVDRSDAVMMTMWVGHGCSVGGFGMAL
jgi:phage terminase large subunit